MMNFFSHYFWLFVLIVSGTNSEIDDNFCFSKAAKCLSESDPNLVRYLFYDVNAPEGFNLRRDVYMRFAVLANKLRRSSNPKLNQFKLVLAPWSHLYHWKHSKGAEHIPWSYYFDLPSLQVFAPVIEMYDFLKEHTNELGYIYIDEVYILQHFDDMFETGNFENRMEITHCEKRFDNFFYYDNITSHSVKCLNFHGPATTLSKILLKSTAKSVLFSQAEVALHDTFGDKNYWEARRSMRFSNVLRNKAHEFRRIYLNSTDEEDFTSLPLNWRDEKPKRDAYGGPYLSVHLRRRDFVTGRPKETPSIEIVVKQVTNVLQRLALSTIFLATDGSEADVRLFEELLPKNFKLLRYIPDEAFLAKYKDGGVAILDQIICSYARYFIGTAESTFSFRIQEEREILGFPVSSTFNVLCKDTIHCKRSSVWKIVF